MTAYEWALSSMGERGGVMLGNARAKGTLCSVPVHQTRVSIGWGEPLWRSCSRRAMHKQTQTSGLALPQPPVEHCSYTLQSRYNTNRVVSSWSLVVVSRVFLWGCKPRTDRNLRRLTRTCPAEGSTSSRKHNPKKNRSSPSLWFPAGDERLQDGLPGWSPSHPPVPAHGGLRD